MTAAGSDTGSGAAAPRCELLGGTFALFVQAGLAIASLGLLSRDPGAPWSRSCWRPFEDPVAGGCWLAQPTPAAGAAGATDSLATALGPQRDRQRRAMRYGSSWIVSGVLSVMPTAPRNVTAWATMPTVRLP